LPFFLARDRQDRFRFWIWGKFTGHRCKRCDPINENDPPPIVYILDENDLPINENPYSGCPFEVSESEDFLFEHFLYRYEVTGGEDPDYLIPFRIIDEVRNFIERERMREWQKKQRE
jgi:hypothetical protein